MTMYLLCIASAVSLVVLIYGAPPLPTKKKTVATMLRLARIGAGDVAVDLGAGDGRIVLAAALRGITAVGFEINPLLVVIAKWHIWRRGMRGRACVAWANMWQKDLSPFSVVFVFGAPGIMGMLGAKLRRELKPGARVISNAFQFPDWRASHKEDGVFVYEI